MAFLKQSRPGRWEIRESRSTKQGPRSRTLATFAELDHTHLALAKSRSEGEFDEVRITEAARRAGAPVALPPADAAGTELLRAIGDGHVLAPGINQLLLDALSPGRNDPATDEALGHIGKSPEQRGVDLVDLMLLSGAVPARQSTAPAYPPMPHGAA